MSSSQKWKAYGGTQQFEKNNNVTFNNLVVGSLTLKNDYVGFFSVHGALTVSELTTLNGNVNVAGSQQIKGSMNVAGNSTFASDVNISHSLDVCGSVIVHGILTVMDDFHINKNVNIGGNVYLSNNVLAMGFNPSSTMQTDNNIHSGKLVCNSFHEGGFMGINTPFDLSTNEPLFYPGATLDIYSDSKHNLQTTTALNVHSSGNTTQSILSSNAYRQGTVFYTDISQCSFHIFHDSSFSTLRQGCQGITDRTSDISYTNYPFVVSSTGTNQGDATMVFSRGGTLDIHVTNNVNVSSDMSIGTRGTRGTKGTKHTLLREKVSIFSDNELTPHLYPYYEQTPYNYNTQQGMSLVAQEGDLSCNIGWSLMTSQGKGMRMLSGSYAYDVYRSMSMQGLTYDVDVSHIIPTQIVVSGTNPAYSRSVTGINLWAAPELDNHVMVINGPTKIGHSEITLIRDVSFSIQRIVSCPRNSIHVMAFGGPNSFDVNRNHFQFPMLSSHDGGKTWVQSDIGGTSPLFDGLASTRFNCIASGAIYDDIYAVIAVNRQGLMFSTRDGGQSWTSMLLTYKNTTRSVANMFGAMKIMNVQNQGNLIAVVDISGEYQYKFNDPSNNLPNYPNIGYIYLKNTQSFTYNLSSDMGRVRNYNFNPDVSFSYTHFPSNMKMIYAMDGYDSSYLFVAGSGIQRYKMKMSNTDASYLSIPDFSWNTNSSYTYYAMKTYKKYLPFTTVQTAQYWTSSIIQSGDVDPRGSWWSNDLLPDTQFSIFVGNGIITRTLNAGLTFLDVSRSEWSDIRFTDVAIYDTSRALVTGKRTTTGEGVMLSTYDSGTTWTPTNPILNDSGVANVLISPTGLPRNLVSMTQVSNNDFLVVREDVSYSQPDSSSNFGMSNLFHCHWPQLFNRSQRVLDVSGSVQITGSLSIEDNLDVGGKITCPVTTIQSDYRIKTNVVDLSKVGPDCTVDDLRPVQYTNTLTGRTDMGFLAHELAEHFPFLVHGDKDVEGEYQSINYVGLIGLLVQEIQDLKEKVNRMEHIVGIGTL